ncbi:hypothetical protein F4803DRAFT_329873 [Xylaria telfairii]|nr:hypothetical protein F4803DRAFT_329873 [Xylaria telfairii]
MIAITMADATSVCQNLAMNPINDSSAGLATIIERPMFSENLQPPPRFGKLSTVYEQSRGPNPGDGVHRFVLARSGAAQGATDHGLDRNNCDGSEQLITAPLTHPEFLTYYNYEGRKFDELTTREKRQLEMAVHYPNIQNGIMRAPLCFRKRPLALPEAAQSEIVNKIFGTRDIFDNIFTYLIPRYEDLSSFCGTSQLIARMVQSSWMHVDSTGDFLGWDKDCLATVRKMEAQEDIKSQTNGGEATKVEPRVFLPTVIISPARPEDQGPVREMVTNGAGYPVTSAVKAGDRSNLALSMREHYKLLHFSFINGYAIKNLVLHGMAWVNIAALECIAYHMPRLEALGVHQCFLLTFADTQPFLRAINAVNKKRSERTRPEPHIAVDFSPFYYKGPPYKPDGSGHIGEYGIIPEEKDWLDSQRAITAQLLGIWNECHIGDQDLLTPGTGFRAFLERIPMRGLPKILRSIAALSDFYNRKHQSRGGSPQWCKIGEHTPSDSAELPIVSSELDLAMEITVWQDLIIACHDKPVTQGQMWDWFVVRGQVKLHHCRACDMHLPSYFYQARILTLREDAYVCHGCQLQMASGKHVWRIFRQRRDLAEKIFRNKRNEELSLCRVLRNIAKPAREEVTAGPGRKPRRAQDAILSLPGTVDTKFLQGAEQLWAVLRLKITHQLRCMGAQIEEIDRVYHSQSFKDRLKLTEKREALQRDMKSLEFQLGISQRKTYDGRLESTCLSWQQLIRERRADIAIRNGTFVNNGPMHILNLQANVASMLGRAGGLPEYWRADCQQESMSSAAAASSQNTAQPVENVPQHTQLVQTTDQSLHNLLPHQRRFPQVAQPVRRPVSNHETSGVRVQEELDEQTQMKQEEDDVVPQPPRWLVRAAAASRTHPHQGWVSMLAGWQSAYMSGRTISSLSGGNAM